MPSLSDRVERYVNAFVVAGLLIVGVGVLGALWLSSYGHRGHYLGEPSPQYQKGLIGRSPEFDDSCYRIDDSPPNCRGDSGSVVAVDTRRRRFLVVWLSNQRLVGDGYNGEPEERVIAKFVSKRGVPGKRHVLATYVGPWDRPSRRRVSAAYLPATDRYVVSWNRVDHFLSATALQPDGPSQPSLWSAQNVKQARDPNARTIDRTIGSGHPRLNIYGQEARIPGEARRLMVFDSPYGVNVRHTP